MSSLSIRYRVEKIATQLMINLYYMTKFGKKKKEKKEGKFLCHALECVSYH